LKIYHLRLEFQCFHTNRFFSDVINVRQYYQSVTSIMEVKEKTNSAALGWKLRGHLQMT